MKTKVLLTGLLMVIFLTSGSTYATHVITVYDGEYATDITVFEYEIKSSTDDNGFLKFYWGFNTTGDRLRIEIGQSVLGEDYIDVFHDGVYLIPMDVYINGVELDRNANQSLYDYWEGVFWQGLIYPIEDGQYNLFDILEDQDPAKWDIRSADSEVSRYNTQSESVFDYETGILMSWVSTISYEFDFKLISPISIESTTESDTADGGNFIDNLDIPVNSMAIFAALSSLTLFRLASRKKN